MFEIRKAGDRGHANHGWLDSHHTFSFGSYYDSRHMGFSALRVINDDRVTPGRGFGAHSHRDMEIVSYVLEGALEHKDSMGNGSVLRPGQVQLMSAGRGVTHSEFNHSATEPVHFLQIWILPDRTGEPAGYQELPALEEPSSKLRLVVSPDGEEGSLQIKQDARIRVARLAPGESIELALRPERAGWLHVATGSVRFADGTLAAGDGAGYLDETLLKLEAQEESQVLVFDLPGPAR
ncbi:MAG TPA: pirin family protein [Polyangiaceae bacterium]|nr:pirin family protein [Polyangiaceae bacterium]